MKVRTINEDLELRNKRRARNRRAIARLVFLVKFFLTTALIITTAVMLALSPLFDIEKIQVRGAVHYTEESLISISGVVMGLNGFKQVGSSPGNMLSLRVGSAEKLIKKSCPYVKDVKVKYLLRRTVVIDVDERTPEAVLPYMGTGLIVDREGFALEVLAQGEQPGLPLIEGLEFEGGTPGEKPGFKDADAFRTAFALLDGIRDVDKTEGDKLFSRVDSVNVGDPEAVVFSVDGRVRVKLSDLRDLNYKLSTARTILNRNIKKDDKGILDFTMGENPVFKPESGG